MTYKCSLRNKYTYIKIQNNNQATILKYIGYSCIECDFYAFHRVVKMYIS